MRLRAICVFVLGGLLVAGLWPLHAPVNDVRWLSDRSGLIFGNYASILTRNKFSASSASDGSCALEIWLQSKRGRSTGTVLAFYQPESRSVPFALRQNQHNVALRQSSVHADRTETVAFGVENVISEQKPVLITVSSGQNGTTAYADGKLAKRLATLRLSNADFAGQLLIGNSPVAIDRWSGELMGLSIYDRELMPDEVSRHYEDWTKGGGPRRGNHDGLAALYLFDESSGNVAHNRIDPSTDLVIPERYFLLFTQIFKLPWQEYHAGWTYWKDIAVNIAGFIPAGLLFFAYFSSLGDARRAAAFTLALGFTVSFTIEFLQAFLPTRNSGTTDLITNTLGTAIGVSLFRHRKVQAALVRFRLVAADQAPGGSASQDRQAQASGPASAKG